MGAAMFNDPIPTRWQRLRAWLRGLPVVCIQIEDGDIGFTSRPLFVSRPEEENEQDVSS